MQGVRDSALHKENHSYLIYELHRCNNEVRESLNITQPCASDTEIDEFLSRKKVGFRVLQYKIDFTNYTEKMTVR